VPSPIGHLLGGAAVAWGGDAIDRRRSSLRFVATCAVLAAAPDLDLLVRGYHRSFTHSLTAVLVVFIVAASVTGRVNSWRAAIVCACAYASHLLLDWLGGDTLPPFGLQVFWPFDHRYFMSGLTLFAETERHNPLSAPTILKNLWAAATEIGILGPIAAGLWLVRVKALARLPAQVPSRDHAPQ
jgi:inner membrane protein